MKRCFLLLSCACLALSSCVTTYSTSRKYVAVDTPSGETVVMNGDTLRHGLTPGDMAQLLDVEPTKRNLARMSRIVYAANSPQAAYGFYDATPEPLTVEIFAADTTYTYRLKAYKSDLFWLNLLSLGVGMLEDSGNDNRYEHPDLYWTEEGYRTFRKNDWTLGVRLRPQPKSPAAPDAAIDAAERRYTRRALRYADSFRKGRVNVSLAFPWTQHFSLYPLTPEIRRNEGGFIGIAAGIEYLYRDKRGIALEANALQGFPMWLPAIMAPRPTKRAPQSTSHWASTCISAVSP